MPTVSAYINHGRWVADCACNGAEIVRPNEQMKCGSCYVVSEVKFPGPKTREQIVAVLKPRPPQNQNWLPGETVKELEAQNIEQGIW